MDAAHFVIPRRLDDPPQLFLWDADEAVLFLFLALLGALLGQAVAGIVLAWLVGRAFARVKAIGGRAIVVRWLYWHTPSAWWCRTRAASHVREHIG